MEKFSTRTSIVYTYICSISNRAGYIVSVDDTSHSKITANIACILIARDTEISLFKNLRLRIRIKKKMNYAKHLITSDRDQTKKKKKKKLSFEINKKKKLFKKINHDSNYEKLFLLRFTRAETKQNKTKNLHK